MARVNSTRRFPHMAGQALRNVTDSLKFVATHKASLRDAIRRWRNLIYTAHQVIIPHGCGVMVVFYYELLQFVCMKRSYGTKLLHCINAIHEASLRDAMSPEIDNCKSAITNQQMLPKNETCIASLRDASWVAISTKTNFRSVGTFHATNG